MVTTYTTKFRLAKTAPGTLDWWNDYYNVMNILDNHVPRIYLSAPRVVLLTLQAGGTLTAGRYYYYKVIAFSDTGCTNGTLASWENVAAQADVTNGTVKVDWSVPVDVNGNPVTVAKYRVYRYDTADAGYVPTDADYNYIKETVAATYTDNGSDPTGAAMPTTHTWYVTEIEQKYTMPDTSEDTPVALVASGSCVDLRDNLNNMRFMLKSLNGKTSWLTAPYTSFQQLTDGKSGGHIIKGGLLATENLDLYATASGSPTTGQIRIFNAMNMKDNVLYGSAVTYSTGPLKGCLVLQGNSADSSGMVVTNSDVNMQDKTLYGSFSSSGNLVLDSTFHGTKGVISILSGVTVSNDKNITMGGTATLTLGSGGLTAAGDVKIVSGKNLTMAGAGILTIGSGGITAAGDVNIASGKNLTMAGAGVMTIGSGGLSGVGGAVVINQPLNRNGHAITGMGDIGTPAAQVGNAYITNLGDSSTGKVTNAYIANLYLGDLNLMNGWKLDDHSDELLWVSPAGKRFRMNLQEVK